LCPDAIPCEEAYQSDCIIYNGPDLTCYGIQTGYSVTQILNIIIAQLDPCTTTTTSTTTVCVRPTGLTTINLNTTLNGVVFSGSLAEACTAYNVHAGDPGSSLSGVTGQTVSATIGQVVYNGIGTDCGIAVNGYYIINNLPGVYQIYNGVIASLDQCLTTTTSSTSTTTTTTINPNAPLTCECGMYTISNQNADPIVVPYTDCLTGVASSVTIDGTNGPGPNVVVGNCGCIGSFPSLPGVIITPDGVCPPPNPAPKCTCITFTNQSILPVSGRTAQYTDCNGRVQFVRDGVGTNVAAGESITVCGSDPQVGSSDFANPVIGPDCGLVGTAYVCETIPTTTSTTTSSFALKYTIDTDYANCNGVLLPPGTDLTFSIETNTTLSLLPNPLDIYIVNNYPNPGDIYCFNILIANTYDGVSPTYPATLAAGCIDCPATTSTTTSTTTTIEPTTSTTTTTIEPTTSTTTTTTADPAITTTTSTTTTSTTTTTTINPSVTRMHIVNNDLTIGMEILAITDLGSGLIIPLDSGTYPVTAGQDLTITIPNGLYDFEVTINNYDIRGSVTLIDSNGTPTCVQITAPGVIMFTGVFLDDAGGTSATSITLLDAAC
jgi:hypothetical protein